MGYFSVVLFILCCQGGSNVRFCGRDPEQYWTIHMKATEQNFSLQPAVCLSVCLFVVVVQLALNLLLQVKWLKQVSCWPFLRLTARRCTDLTMCGSCWTASTTTGGYQDRAKRLRALIWKWNVRYRTTFPFIIHLWFYREDDFTNTRIRSVCIWRSKSTGSKVLFPAYYTFNLDPRFQIKTSDFKQVWFVFSFV